MHIRNLELREHSTGQAISTLESLESMQAFQTQGTKLQSGAEASAVRTSESDHFTQSAIPGPNHHLASSGSEGGP
jgi:hypothetical protein